MRQDVCYSNNARNGKSKKANEDYFKEKRES